MLKALVFDLGNVLVFFDRMIAIRNIVKLTGVSADLVDQILHVDPAARAYEIGEITTDDFVRNFTEKSGVAVDKAALAQAASDIFSPNDEMIAIVEEARSRGLRTALLSNTNEAHFSHLWSQFLFLHRFDALILSYRAKMMKPAPAIYEMACQAVGCRPEETFFTDDLAENVEAAHRCGMHALQFIDATSYRARLEQLLQGNPR